MNFTVQRKPLAIFTLILLVSLMGLSSLTVAQELLKSPSFGSSDGWNNCGNEANYSINSGTLSTTGTACIFQTVEATEGNTYTLMCHPRSAAAYSTIALSMLNSNSESILQDVTLVDSETGVPEVSSLVAPTGTAFVAVTIYSEGPVTHESCSLIASGVSTAPIVNRSLVNPEFDTQEGWVNCADTSTSWISHGQLNMVGNQQGSACAFQTVSATAGRGYTLSCQSRSIANHATISLSALSSSYGIMLQDIEIVNNPATQTKQAYLTAPEGTEYISVTLYSEGSTTHESCSLSF